MLKQILLILVFQVLNLRAAVASTSSAQAYALLSADEKRMLVMTTGNPRFENTNYKQDPYVLPDGRKIVLFDSFSKSGVYDIATFAPVWQVDWYTYKHDLRASPDLDDLAVVSDHSFETGKGWGLSFFHQGKVTRRYRCDELLKSLRSKILFPLTSYNWHLDWYETFKGQGDKLIFTTAPRLLGAAHERLNLGMQDAWVFSLRTGEVLESKTLGTARFVTFLTVLGILLLVPLPLWLLRRRGRRSP